MNRTKNIILPVIIIAFGVALSIFIAAGAQTSAPPATAGQGITFPVPELGNCVSQSDCQNYCNRPENISACITFAKAHGLMNREEADRAEKFSQSLGTTGGPGGCKTPAECQNFCGKIENLDVCLKFAKDHNISVPDSDEAEKILNYIKSGGKMPGGCDSKDSCEAYCSDFDHADECLAFSEKSGLGPPSEPGGPTSEQIKKMMELTKKGESPGGCKSKEQCETYCGDSSHFEECISFAEKAGMVSPRDAELARKTGGKGPGGCNSKDSCEAYCNKPENQETCFNFAKEHNLISPEQLQQMKEGLTRLREGLAQAPPEVTACLKSTLGPSIIDDIQSGKLVPGPDIGDRVRDCFSKFGHSGDPSEVFKNAPPEVLSCLKDKLGDEFEKIRSGQEMPTPEIADAFRVCFQNVQLQGGFGGGPGGQPQESGGPPPEVIINFLRTAPPEIASCLKEKLGDEEDKIASGQPPSPDDMEKVKECFEEFHPQGGPQMVPPQGVPPIPPQGGFPNAGMQQMEAQWNAFPPQVQNCLIQELGNDRLARIKQGEGTTEDQKEVPQVIEKCFQNLTPQGSNQGGTLPPPTSTQFNNYQYPQPYPQPSTMPPPPPQPIPTSSPSSFRNENSSFGTLLDAFAPLVSNLFR